jgi:hypothetical protein
VEGDTSPAGRAWVISIRYFAYSAAWSLVPRPASSTNRGARSANGRGGTDGLDAVGEQSAPHLWLFGDLGGHQPAGCVDHGSSVSKTRGSVEARSPA